MSVFVATNSRDWMITFVTSISIFLMMLFLLVYIFSLHNSYLNVSSPVPIVTHTTNNIVIPTVTLPNTFYGVDVDISQLLPTSKEYVKNNRGQDLIDIAHHLGINMFRITSVSRSFNDGKSEQLYTKDQWATVFNKMARNNIWGVVLIETLSNNPDLNKTELNDSYLQLVKNYIIDPQVPSFPNVYGIDIKNEPLLDKNNLSYLQKAASVIKASYPGTKITIGGWKTDMFRLKSDGTEQYSYGNISDAALIDNIVDFYSPHIYGFDKKTISTFFSYPNPYTLALNNLREMIRLAHGKSILPDEFGAPNGDAVSDQEAIGSSQLQANTYNGMYQAINTLHDQGILGAMSYLFMSRNHRNDSWAIIKDNGNYFYPAAYVLQKYATGKSDIPLSLPYNNIPDDILLTNQQNNSIQTISVGDIIGFNLTFPSSNQYALTVDNTKSLFSTEPLQYYNAINKYNAVFHAVKPGTSIIIIKSINPCPMHQQSVKCQEETNVYTVTIIVR